MLSRSGKHVHCFVVDHDGDLVIGEASELAGGGGSDGNHTDRIGGRIVLAIWILEAFKCLLGHEVALGVGHDNDGITIIDVELDDLCEFLNVRRIGQETAPLVDCLFAGLCQIDARSYDVAGYFTIFAPGLTIPDESCGLYQTAEERLDISPEDCTFLVLSADVVVTADD